MLVLMQPISCKRLSFFCSRQNYIFLLLLGLVELLITRSVIQAPVANPQGWPQAVKSISPLFASNTAMRQ
jgi:hypothetical protein